MSSSPIDEALADLETARTACLEALADRFTMGADNVRAASELRHIARQRLDLLKQREDEENVRRERAETPGLWRS